MCHAALKDYVYVGWVAYILEVFSFARCGIA